MQTIKLKDELTEKSNNYVRVLKREANKQNKGVSFSQVHITHHIRQVLLRA